MGESDFEILGRNPTEMFIEAVSGIFQSLGRALICLDPEFRVVHASEGLDELAVPGSAEAIVGQRAERILGTDLFGEEGSLRRALQSGERREGWGATLSLEGVPSRLLSVSAAPVAGIESPLCDPRVAYLLVVTSVEDPLESDTAPPTIFSGMVGRSSSMLRIFRLIQSLQESDATVLLTGESGTGKELVARALHVASPRREGAFVAVNCGALPGELLESELFGHVRGAFTGAVRDREGRFEAAAGGTLFLDEVGDLSLPLQVKLLRVLQERSFERVGENRTRTTDARIVAATNQDLQRAVFEGRFREDLYYRLRVVPINVPPLRKRREDIAPLARHLLARVGARTGRTLKLSPEALRTLLGYPWPGNARELENALEYAVAVCKGQTIHPQDLPEEVSAGRAAPGTTGAPLAETPAGAPAAPAPAAATADSPANERERLRAALDAHRWNRVETARALGVSRTTLWRRMRELGLGR